MVRILLISDNHGNWSIVEKIIKKEKYDYSIHLGDAEVSEQKIALSFDKYVAGNHDNYSITTDTLEINGLKIIIMHGHLFGISFFSPKNQYIKYAKNHKADVLIHGHTHIPRYEFIDGVHVICPGSVAHGRSSEGNTYGILTIDDNKEVKIEFHPC